MEVAAMSHASSRILSVPEDFAPSAVTLSDILRLRAERTPDTRAFLFLEGGAREGASLTFGELDMRACAIASRLTSHGLRGQQVLLLHPPGLEFVASFYGCLYAGCVAVPSYASLFNSRHLSRLQFIVRDAEVKLILGAADSVNAFRQALSSDELSRLPALLGADEVRNEEANGWT
ncbi:MAG TPA: AMP-binding protein, partial [Pyrinomonadaceae bacterium]|nr:AMP-binding protein [Pyrinomonadaceae bacterium]